jgi:anti-sigma factor RsiW
MALDAAIVARDAALTAFPEGVDEAFVSAKAAVAASIAERENVAAEFASLNRTIEERKKRIDAALAGRAHQRSPSKRLRSRTAQGQLTTAKTSQNNGHTAITSVCRSSY